jgi:hypothetical protein
MFVSDVGCVLLYVWVLCVVCGVYVFVVCYVLCVSVWVCCVLCMCVVCAWCVCMVYVGCGLCLCMCCGLWVVLCVVCVCFVLWYDDVYLRYVISTTNNCYSVTFGWTALHEQSSRSIKVTLDECYHCFLQHELQHSLVLHNSNWIQ